jgi:hypothetical protein
LSKVLKQKPILGKMALTYRELIFLNTIMYLYLIEKCRRTSQLLKNNAKSINPAAEVWALDPALKKRDI